MPRLLDLFCGAGGCSVGYARAGFDVEGVDREPHPDYPFQFHLADALEVLADRGFLAGFDVIHASPPCQAHTAMSNRHRGKGGRADSHVDLIPPVRAALEAWGGIYVIENVVGSGLRSPVMLRGGMFGLRVDRPRLFETNALLLGFHSPRATDIVGVYGAKADGRRLITRADGSELRAAASLEEAQQAMGTPWMSDFRDVAEAVPPAYTEYLGEQLLAYVTEELTA